VAALGSYIDAIDKLANGARHRVAVFELNANNHDQRRALANAAAIGAAQRDGRIPVVTSANALQVDHQNDNGWDQGLLFLNPSHVWLQPPGYVTQMIARNYLECVVDAEVGGADDALRVTATRSEDGKRLTLQVVNAAAQPGSTRIRLDHFRPANPVALVEELAGPLTAHNTADDASRIIPRQTEWRMQDGEAPYVFAPYSFTIIRFN
jgi:alpha-L-arabinofuranosidase